MAMGVCVGVSVCRAPPTWNPRTLGPEPPTESVPCAPMAGLIQLTLPAPSPR
jgi:hypothetical protein